MPQLYKLDNIRPKFEELGWQLTATTYLSYDHLLDCICPKGHKTTISWRKFRRSHSCVECRREKQNLTYIEERKCWGCGFVKPRTEFHRDRHDKYGLQKVCKKCTQEHNKKFRLDNPHYSGIRYRSMSEEEKELFNKNRYQKNPEKFKANRKKGRLTLNGRLKDLLRSTKERAKRKQLPFDLDEEWLEDKFTSQGCRCALTDIPFDFNPLVGGMMNHFAPSIDKIDNDNGGYIKSNSRLICWGLNAGFNRFGEAAYEKIARAYLMKKYSQASDYCI